MRSTSKGIAWVGPRHPGTFKQPKPTRCPAFPSHEQRLQSGFSQSKIFYFASGGTSQCQASAFATPGWYDAGSLNRRKNDSGQSREPIYPLSLPRRRTACPYFCSFVIKVSPCFTTSAYCLFLSSGRLVSMITLTRSIVHGIRSPAMNLARSLQISSADHMSEITLSVQHKPVKEVHRHAEIVRHAVHSDDPVAL